MQAAICVNQTDPNLPECSPPVGGLAKVTVKNARELVAPEAITASACSPFVDFTIEARINDAGKCRAKKSRAKIKGKARAVEGTRPRGDADKWIVQCAPREFNCPAALR
jgi:hypothetical protein